MNVRTLIGIAGIAAFATSASAQWVNFDDETDTRLVLTTVGILDTEEKDIDVADFDKDGWMDVIVVRKRVFSTPGARQDVLLMNEQGTLVDRTVEYAPGFQVDLTDARDVVCTDINNDGWTDLVICTTFEDPIAVYMNEGGTPGQWNGFVDESFRVPPITSTNIQRFCAVASGDIEGDGDEDLLFVNYDGGDNVLFVNDGQGNYTDETNTRLGNLANVGFGTGGQFRDMDNDGDLDIAMSEAGQVSIQFNNGQGFFNKEQSVYGGATYMMDTGDLNDDGMLDFYQVDDGQDRTIIATSVQQDGNNFYQTFTANPSPRTTGFGGNIHMTDIDRDGDLDVGVAPIDVDIANCPNGGQIGDRKTTILQNNSSGQVSDPWASNNDQNFHLPAHDFFFLDINNDGCDDLFMGLCQGWRVFIQNADDCSAIIDDCPADFDGDGDLDFDDTLIFRTAFKDGDLIADINEDGVLDIVDFIQYQFWFNGGCEA